MNLKYWGAGVGVGIVVGLALTLIGVVRWEVASGVGLVIALGTTLALGAALNPELRGNPPASN